MSALRKYAAISRINMQNAFTYRGNVAGSLILYTMFIYVFYSLWKAIFSSGEVLSYTHTQVVWYLIVTELILLGARFNIVGQVNEDVKTGALAYTLGRPLHYVAYLAASTLGGVLVNLMFFGGLALVLGMVFAGPIAGFAWWALPLMLLSGLLGVALQFSFHMAIGLTAFHLEDNTGIFLIFQKFVFMLGALLPVEILPKWLQGIARLLPFSYVAWAPARLTVAFSWQQFAQVVPLQAMWVALAMGLTLVLYRSGTRSLQANGG
jgi:ABC-2 type transport system permease protein